MTSEQEGKWHEISNKRNADPYSSNFKTSPRKSKFAAAVDKHKTGTEISSSLHDSTDEEDEEDDQGFIVGGRRLLKPVKIND